MMSESKLDHLALFGNVRIVRSLCPECERWAFVLDGERGCCGMPYTSAHPERFKRIVEPEQRRRILKVSEKRAILEAQENRCFYCELEFGTYAIHHGRLKQVRLNWDHLVPFNFSQNNSAENYVAACGFCNQWKRDMVFQTVEEAKVFIANRWAIERNRQEVPPSPDSLGASEGRKAGGAL
jgi:hypothetical protein